MSIFESIVSKIFHHGGEAAAPQPTAEAAPAAAADAPAPDAAAPTATAAASTPAPSASAGGGQVDVAAVLEGLAAKNPQTLDWRHSIVDMLKLLDLDSSLSARKELAKELNYTGDTNESAAMNVWLHGQVMKKLAENGGKVPADLKG